MESLGAHDERRLLEILTALEQVTGIRTLNRAGTLERRGYANAAIRDLDKGYLVQRVNGLHVSDGAREGALVRLHGEMQGDGDLVRLLLIRANEQKAVQCAADYAVGYRTVEIVCGLAAGSA